MSGEEEQGQVDRAVGSDGVSQPLIENDPGNANHRPVMKTVGGQRIEKKFWDIFPAVILGVIKKKITIIQEIIIVQGIAVSQQADS